MLASAPRERINFDFAWRFHLGDPSNAECPPNAFPRKPTGIQCKGLTCDCTATNVTECRAYDDSAWAVVDAPHDALIGGAYMRDGDKNQAYLPINVTWYRKHFNLPGEWQGKSMWIYFEGVFRASTIWINGDLQLYHDSGYTSFSLRLDNISSVRYGDGVVNENVIAVRAEGEGGSGSWYEGAGIYRHNYVVATSRQHIAVDGVYGASTIPDEVKPRKRNESSSLEGMLADVAVFRPRVEVVNDANESTSVRVEFRFYDESDEVVGRSLSTTTIGPSTSVLVNASVHLMNAELWSLARPYMYEMQTVISSESGNVLDIVNVSIGIRRSVWDSDKGFFLNDEPVKWLGFSNRDDFAGVGVAVPDRVHLYRVQALGGIGGNAWRTGHNPPAPFLLDLFDRLGILVWVENRQFGNRTTWVENQRDMVRRDRNHPSVMVWSFCSDAGCIAGNDSTETEIAKIFKKASNDADPYRPVAANMNSGIGNGLTQVIDVQGLSHRDGKVYDSFRADYPNKPVIGSECCSCPTYRGEDVTNASACVLASFDGGCSSEQNGWEMSRSFAGGELVWTLFDYYGDAEPFAWPQVSSAFGSFDLAGFVKPSAFWYKAWWFYNSTNTTSSIARSPQLVDHRGGMRNKWTSARGFFVYIIQDWEPDLARPLRTIRAYTNAPMVELLVNGVSVGVQNVRWLGWAEWNNLTYAPGSLTAFAKISSRESVAEYFVETVGRPMGLIMAIDAPYNWTGTGRTLVLDGQDAALIRAYVVDIQGNPIPSSSHNVSFRIVSGPGRIIGVGNGNPNCHEPNKATWRSAYHGLVRAVVQVTENYATSDRDRILQIDSDAGKRTKIIPSSSKIAPPGEIVVSATVEGLTTSKLSIPLTTNMSESVLAVAKKLGNG